MSLPGGEHANRNARCPAKDVGLAQQRAGGRRQRSPQPARYGGSLRYRLEFGHLRAEPALECGAPLRSPRCAGLGGLTPPFPLNMLGLRMPPVGKGGSYATVLRGALKGGWQLSRVQTPPVKRPTTSSYS